LCCSVGLVWQFWLRRTPPCQLLQRFFGRLAEKSCQLLSQNQDTVNIVILQIFLAQKTQILFVSKIFIKFALTFLKQLTFLSSIEPFRDLLRPQFRLTGIASQEGLVYVASYNFYAWFFSLCLYATFRLLLQSISSMPLWKVHPSS